MHASPNAQPVAMAIIGFVVAYCTVIEMPVWGCVHTAIVDSLSHCSVIVLEPNTFLIVNDSVDMHVCEV